MFIINRYTMIYVPIFVNIVLLLLFGYRYLFFSLISFYECIYEYGDKIEVMISWKSV